MSKMIDIKHTFPSMGSDIQAIVSVPRGREFAGFQVLKRAELMFTLLERVINRFMAGSELSALNASAGHSFSATPLLFEAIDTALQAARLTGGSFDPTIPACWKEIEYICDIKKIPDGQRETEGISTGSRKTWRDIRLNPTHHSVYLPPGCSLDLGGIGTGWAVDQISRIFLSFPGYYLDAGGNIRVGGRQASGAPWTIAIADPSSQRDLRVFELNDGSACTTAFWRQWSEPTTISATIISETSAASAAIARAALILGPENGLQLVRSLTGVSGLLVLADGEILTSPGFPQTISSLSAFP